MSYQVLARKWRPRRFAELVGQEHVVRALTHALETDRVHHAFLFTGTRGVGKTTIARIFAKSLNCERGVSADPCGTCGNCVDIDAGRFLDLLEIDAASNTGVDDVREVIENAQYRPARGAYKVYLIDEVHMLSKSAFNALLKTLEEPPLHAKFLLATTDPQKLPVTVLSRCLQFNLRRLTEAEIEGQLTRILDAEGIDAHADAVAEIARAGQGSMRDALSLLDQAIAFGGGRLAADDVRAMLGTIDRGRVRALLEAIVAQDAERLWAEIQRIADFAPDFGAVLDELAALLHRVQLAQLVPAAVDATDEGLADLARTLAPEETQLLYQLAVTGRRDLGLAPSPRAGFDMALLRMLAFAPAQGGGERGTAERAPPAPPRPTPIPSSEAVGQAGGRPGDAGPRAGKSVSPGPALGSPPAIGAAAHPHGSADAGSTRAFGAAPSSDAGAAPPARSAGPMPASETMAAPAPSIPADAAGWADLIARAGLRGPARELAMNAMPLALEGRRLVLGVDAAHEALAIDATLSRLGDALARTLGVPGLEVAVRKADLAADSPAARARRAAEAEQRALEAIVEGDPFVQQIKREFGGRVVAGSIRPNRPE
jgi:DNA polymerase-3 subunit gamma/tau